MQSLHYLWLATLHALLWVPGGVAKFTPSSVWIMGEHGRPWECWD